MALRDAIARFLTERTHVELRYGVSSTCIYGYYEQWCRGENLRPCVSKTFHEIMKELGNEQRTTERAKGFWYDLDVVVEELGAGPVERVREHREPKKLERVEVVCDMHFAGGEVITAGTVLQRVEPNDWQKERLVHHHEGEKQIRGPATPGWITCLWDGRTIFVSGEDVRRALC